MKNKAFMDKSCELDAFLLEFDHTALGVIYNHSQRNSTNFLEYLDPILKTFKTKKKQVTTYSANLLRTNKIKVAESFLNLMLSNFYQPII